MNYTKNKRKGTLKKILSFFEGIITILIVVTCLIIIIQRLSDNEESFMGYRLFKVESGSMVPKYNINDVILVTEKEPKEIKEGDDLVYVGLDGEYAGRIITHQVVRIEEHGAELKFYTRGLANNIEDPVVQPEQVIGVVKTEIKTLTLITNILLNPYSLYFLIVLPVTITIFLREVHSKDVKERYIQKQIEREKAQKEDKKSSKGKKDNTAKKSPIQKNTRNGKNAKT